MPSVWTAEADRDLLLSIIDENKLQGLDWHAIAAKINSKSEKYNFTHEGCRYVYWFHFICHQHNFTAFICHLAPTVRLIVL